MMKGESVTYWLFSLTALAMICCVLFLAGESRRRNAVVIESLKVELESLRESVAEQVGDADRYSFQRHEEQSKELKAIREEIDGKLTVKPSQVLDEVRGLRGSVEGRTDDRFRGSDFEAFMKANPSLNRGGNEPSGN